MTKVAVLKQDGSQAAELELNDAVFAIEPNNAVITDAVLMQRASMRQGTHAVKNRSASSDQHLVHMPTVLTVSLTNWL